MSYRNGLLLERGRHTWYDRVSGFNAILAIYIERLNSDV